MVMCSEQVNQKVDFKIFSFLIYSMANLEFQSVGISPDFYKK